MKKKFYHRISIQLTFIIFSVLLASFLCLSIFGLIVFAIGDFEITGRRYFISPMVAIFLISLISLFFGLCLSTFGSKTFLKPIDELIIVTQKVAKGNFDVKIDEKPENEIGDLVENFNIMVSELQKNETLKSDFISNVSHEFKTPLSNISGYATLLQDESLSPQERNLYTQNIIEATNKLSTLVSNILKISKIDNQKITIDKVKYQLDEQIRESILSLEKMWSEKNINFDIELNEVEIQADQNLILNVWNNILSNAIKFSSFNGKIIVKLYQNDGKAIVSIQDFGCGIAPDAIPYIFDKFYQADKSHGKDGNGLGLALVKKIITVSKGNISVDSIQGKGTRFIINLPLN